MNWHAYEQRKRAWMAANPHATPEDYEHAAIREFLDDETEARVPPAPALCFPSADDKEQTWQPGIEPA